MGTALIIATMIFCMSFSIHLVAEHIFPYSNSMELKVIFLNQFQVVWNQLSSLVCIRIRVNFVILLGSPLTERSEIETVLFIHPKMYLVMVPVVKYKSINKASLFWPLTT
jgi:hypothetical protein